MNLLSCLDRLNNSLFKHGLENDVPIGCHAHKIVSQDLGGTWGLYAHSHSSAELFMGGCIVLLPLPCTMHCFRLRRHLQKETYDSALLGDHDTTSSFEAIECCSKKHTPLSSISCSFNLGMV